MTSQLRIKVENFRAIKSADIELSGITVVTGLNGCGKSTLSKLLYHAVMVAEDLEERVMRAVQKKMGWVARTIDYVEFVKTGGKSVHATVRDDGIVTTYAHVTINTHPTSISSLDDLQKYELEIIERIKRQILEIPKKGQEEVKQFLCDHVLENAEKNTSMDAIFEGIASGVDAVFTEAREQLARRDIQYLYSAFISAFEESVPCKNVNLYQQNRLLTKHAEKSFLPVFFVEKTAYIDSPMVIGTNANNESHWGHLRDLLREKISPDFIDHPILRLIREEVIRGEVSQGDSLTGNFVFKQNGNNYDLSHCATGVKSIAILYRLLVTGFFGRSTLLIIDEPEAHLHPQWVMEYARIVVLLHKELGVRFFIASHSPEMVSAIQEIAEKEAVAESLNFYLAEEDEAEPFKFVYHSEKQDIHRIFQCFNKVFDMIDDYRPAK